MRNAVRLGSWACLAFVFSGAMTALAQSGPTVSNVTASQQPGNSRRVDIYYNLAASGPCTVWVVASDNGGTTWSVPVQTVTGAVGPNVNPGTNKQATWDAGADIPGKAGSFRMRVYADDGVNSSMVLIPAGNFPYQNNFSSQVYVAAFLIDKYEVTVQRYCEFLNAADPNGTYWTSNQEITRSGTPPNVFYTVNSGRQNYPIRYVSHDDAAAMANWLSTRDARTWRLPTEHEWEKAASWDTLLQKHWTYGFLNDTISCAWCSYHNGSIYCGGSSSSPTEVGHYNGTGGTSDAHSYFGAYDMSGNVWEWTSSIYSGSYRVLRGGAWSSSATYCTSTNRDINSPSARSNDYGFRLALDLE